MGAEIDSFLLSAANIESAYSNNLRGYSSVRSASGALSPVSADICAPVWLGARVFYSLGMRYASGPIFGGIEYNRSKNLLISCALGGKSKLLDTV